MDEIKIMDKVMVNLEKIKEFSSSKVFNPKIGKEIDNVWRNILLDISNHLISINITDKLQIDKISEEVSGFKGWRNSDAKKEDYLYPKIKRFDNLFLIFEKNWISNENHQLLSKLVDFSLENRHDKSSNILSDWESTWSPRLAIKSSIIWYSFIKSYKSLWIDNKEIAKMIFDNTLAEYFKYKWVNAWDYKEDIINNITIFKSIRETNAWYFDNNVDETLLLIDIENVFVEVLNENKINSSNPKDIKNQELINNISQESWMKKNWIQNSIECGIKTNSNIPSIQKVKTLKKLWLF